MTNRFLFASALAGSVVGGLTSGVASWLSQRAQPRESQFAREMARRDDLYKEFIAAASKAYGEAIVSNEPNVQELVALYAMISRMRVKSPPQTVACADFAPGKTIREFHELVQSRIWNRSPVLFDTCRSRPVIRLGASGAKEHNGNR